MSLFGDIQSKLDGLSNTVTRRFNSAGDRAFGRRLFWVKYRFADERAEYYFDLASRMEANPGVPFTEFFAKDAQRYPDEPKGVLSSIWLARYEGIDGHEQAATFCAARFPTKTSRCSVSVSDQVISSRRYMHCRRT